MAKCDVYDEEVSVRILRKGKVMEVSFCDLLAGDIVERDNCFFVVESDAHRCDDAHYDGYVVYSDTGESYFPEDFGAELVQKGK